MANVNTNKVITVSLVKKYGACQESIAFFERNFPERLFPAGVDLSKIKVTGDYKYYIDMLLKLPICEYNDKGNMIREIYPDGETIQFEYDDKGNMTKKIYPLGYFYQYEYDENNNKIREIYYNGKFYKYEFEYDDKGNMTKKKYPSGYFYQFEYDEKGNMIKEILPGNYIIKYEYNDTGNMTKKTSPDGDVYQWEYKYDEMGRLIKAEDMTIEYFE